MKTYRIWKRLVVVLVSSLCHVAGVFMVSTPRSAVTREPFRIESWDKGGVDEMGGWVCVGGGGYMSLHSHQHKQNRSEFRLSSRQSQGKHSEENLWGG